MVESQSYLCHLARDYFSHLFAGQPSDLEKVIAEVPPKLTEVENSQILVSFTLEGFRRATFHMHPDETSGPVGLNIAFYRHLWDTCSQAVLQSFMCWLEDGVIPKTINNTNIALKLKYNVAESMRDLRPISLCKAAYKILYRTLANRLTKMIAKCVSEEQSAFVAGRSIIDNALITNIILSVRGSV